MRRSSARQALRLRSGACIACLGALVGTALTATAACSPLQLDLTVADASVPADAADATAHDAFVGDAFVADTMVADAVAPVDAQDGGVDSGTSDSSPPSDANDEAGQPVPCSSNTDCLGDAGTPLCDTDAGLCVQCLSSADCTKSNALHCLNGFCGACATDTDCSDAGAPGMVCNRFIPRCASSCMNGTDCPSEPCDTTDGWCVECTSDVYCMGVQTGIHCYLPPAGVCGCQRDTDCPSPAKPTCGPPNPMGNRFCE
jgi:hypothetical protein